MAKGKKPKVGGKSRGTPRHRNPSGGYPSKSPRTPRSSKGGWTSDEDIGPATFTLKDAAQARDSGSFRGGSGSLRHQTIGFIRSSDPTSVEPEDDDDKIEQDLEQDMEVQQEEPKPKPMLKAASIPAPTHPAPIQPPRPPSRTGSASSEEIVLFRGRSAAVSQAPTPQPQLPQKAFLSQTENPVPNVDTPVVEKKAHKPSANNDNVEEDAVQVIADLMDHDDAEDEEGDVDDDPTVWEDFKDAEWISEDGLAQLAGQKLQDIAKASTRSKTNARMPSKVSRQSTRGRMSRKEEAIDAALADYVENMRENGDDTEDMLDTSGIDEERVERDGWNSSDLEDFDELSTSEEILESVEHVLSKRHRPSGLQYLIVWEGQGVDEARWIPHDQLVMKGAAELVAAFEEEEKNAPVYEDDDDEDDDEDDDDSDEDSEDEIDSGDDDEAFLDEVDLIERRQARLDDEKLARLLAKQEALGLGSDELLLFDQGFAENDPAEFSDGFIPFGRSARRKNRKSPRRQRNLEFLKDDLEDMDIDPSDDDILGDGDGDNANYGSFDITDRSRASIARRGGAAKDKKNDPLTWGLSDSDQADALRSAWEADRSKKKLKKQEREDLRMQGLLGKKNKFKPDLKARYSDGMSLEHLGRELEDFLLNDDMQSRALPPMEKRDRKTVHEVASMFGLKSLSKGSGKSRFAVLQKTNKTIDFDATLFARMRSQVDRRFYGRMDKKGKSPRGGPMPPKRSGGIGSRADIGYREGDVVGANAPVLGADNRGRAMLEKMGWSMGMALGGKDSKGILLPIQHVVKNSKAGLG